ncbi:DNA polymerase alpha/epsilon subunit B-domain-containing protein [Geopyxis carbonaria]|nr:DNA polymerase alpha/epsilon subunit B-domain-containing protein [Geopyxis carbonaria]
MPPKNTSYFTRRAPPPSSAVPTSDPFEPLPPSSQLHVRPARILAVDIPPATLRPIAFRVFTKKHNLTLKSDALTVLCGFIGRRCGAAWRDSGSGEKTLDEVARLWKRAEGAGRILVDGGEALRGVLRSMEVQKEAPGGLSRHNSFDVGEGMTQGSGMGGTGVDGEGDVEMDEDAAEELADQVDPREYLKFVSPFEMPRLVYNATRKMFEKQAKPNLLAPPAAKTALFRHRYNLMHARLLRTDSFLAPTYSKATAPTAAAKTHLKLTAISALLGRAGQTFLLFGMLAHSPTGQLSLYDPSGELPLDVAPCAPNNATWFTPGMFVLLDGCYEPSGTFTVFTAASPPVERRRDTADVHGHLDFLGVGVPLDWSVAPHGGRAAAAMRRVEHALPASLLVLGCVALDDPHTLPTLRRFLTLHEPAPPLTLVLTGSFASTPVTNTASRAYKERFDALASLFSEFPSICAHTSLVLVPGDNDPWASTFAAGAAPLWPRAALPAEFTTRLRRAVARVSALPNPCRVSYFTSELVIARDDVLPRLQRNCVRMGSHTAADVGGDAGGDAATVAARRIVKTLLDQATLAPFPTSVRPVAWEAATAGTALYPLPTAVLLVDPAMGEGWAVTYEGCHVLNPGRFVKEGGRGARWGVYRMGEGRGEVAGF